MKNKTAKLTLLNFVLITLIFAITQQVTLTYFLKGIDSIAAAVPQGCQRIYAFGGFSLAWYFRGWIPTDLKGGKVYFEMPFSKVGCDEKNPNIKTFCGFTAATLFHRQEVPESDAMLDAFISTAGDCTGWPYCCSWSKLCIRQ